MISTPLQQQICQVYSPPGQCRVTLYTAIQSHAMPATCRGPRLGIVARQHDLECLSKRSITQDNVDCVKTCRWHLRPRRSFPCSNTKKLLSSRPCILSKLFLQYRAANTSIRRWAACIFGTAEQSPSATGHFANTGLLLRPISSQSVLLSRTYQERYRVGHKARRHMQAHHVCLWPVPLLTVLSMVDHQPASCYELAL